MGVHLFTWFWAKFLGRDSIARDSATAQPIKSPIETWKTNARALLAKDANWQLVRESLGRLEEAGLRINPELDLDLIVVRFLRDFANQFEGDDLATVFSGQERGGAASSIDLAAFEDLTRETDALIDFEDIDVVLSKLSTMSEEDLDNLITLHSDTIFENAFTICIVNEHGPGEFVPRHVRELETLACGDFTVESVVETTKPQLLVGGVTLSDGQCASFEIGIEKRPDLTPFLKAMNSLIAHLEKGRFVAVITGSGDNFIVLYLRPQEQAAFRDWSQQQRFADGSIPDDWLN